MESPTLHLSKDFFKQISLGSHTENLTLLIACGQTRLLWSAILTEITLGSL